MRTLLLLRHAEAASVDSKGLDHERPLTDRGRRAAAGVGKRIEAEQVRFDAVLCSSAVRAKATAEAVTHESRFSGPVHYDRRLYLAEPAVYLALLRELLEQSMSVLVVGHNPGLETLVEELSGRHVQMPPAGLAVLSVAIDSWQELALDQRAELLRFVQPDLYY
jgi:phosphohistidine phosphatase